MFLLQSPRRVDSNKHTKCMFCWRIKWEYQWKNTRSADFCADQIDVITNFAVIMNVVIKRVHCIFLLLVVGKIISIFHVCMVWIEKSVMRLTDRHHEACRVMPNSDPEWQIFLSTPYTHDRYFFLHTFWLTTFDFQSRTCYEITLFPLKGFYLSLKKSTLPATAVRFFRLTSNLHKVTSFSDVTAVKIQHHLTT